MPKAPWGWVSTTRARCGLLRQQPPDASVGVLLAFVGGSSRARYGTMSSPAL
ncbi:MAG: hypothetical protein ACR2K2_02265 [Mycobacteriales bacterium]